MPTPPRRWFQFGLWELEISVAIFAVGLGFCKWIVWIGNQNLADGQHRIPSLVFAVGCIICCAFTSVGVLFGRGRKAAVCGAMTGAVVAWLLAQVLSIITTINF